MKSAKPMNDSRPQPIERATQKQLGMTLLEIMIVLAILALVMGLLVGPRIFRMFGESKTKLAYIEAKKLANESYPEWSTHNRATCPKSLKELTKYTDKDDIKDPWGNDYVMHCGDNKPPGKRKFGVASKGEDGKAGNDDDVKSWEEQ